VQQQALSMEANSEHSVLPATKGQTALVLRAPPRSAVAANDRASLVYLLTDMHTASWGYTVMDSRGMKEYMSELHPRSHVYEGMLFFLDWEGMQNRFTHT
jgi:hypothetical protein